LVAAEVAGKVSVVVSETAPQARALNTSAETARSGTMEFLCILLSFLMFDQVPNGVRYPQVGGRGFCLRAV